MILPIFAYGQPVLRRKADPITRDHAGLEELIRDMWETMYNAHGVGLAAPQIGQSIRLFVVDTVQLEKEGSDHKGIKKVFINAEILDESGHPWSYEEGCLSIPELHGDVERQPEVVVRYRDEQFVEHTETWSGMNARVIQHEYDHIEGILFIDHMKPLRRKLINRRLEKLRKGEVEVNFPMRFARN
jgi:peptide deformylase